VWSGCGGASSAQPTTFATSAIVAGSCEQPPRAGVKRLLTVSRVAVARWATSLPSLLDGRAAHGANDVIEQLHDRGE